MIDPEIERTVIEHAKSKCPTGGGIVRYTYALSNDHYIARQAFWHCRVGVEKFIAHGCHVLGGSTVVRRVKRG